MHSDKVDLLLELSLVVGGSDVKAEVAVVKFVCGTWKQYVNNYVLSRPRFYS